MLSAEAGLQSLPVSLPVACKFTIKSHFQTANSYHSIIIHNDKLFEAHPSTVSVHKSESDRPVGPRIPCSTCSNMAAIVIDCENS